MEMLKIYKDEPKYDFVKEEEYLVKRNINNGCVVLTKEDKPNLIFNEIDLKQFGSLTGFPEIG